jgi:tetratricopeptide (TPR) repeat protein
MAVAYLIIWSYCCSIRSQRIGRVSTGASSGQASGSPVDLDGVDPLDPRQKIEAEQLGDAATRPRTGHGCPRSWLLRACRCRAGWRRRPSRAPPRPSSSAAESESLRSRARDVRDTDWSQVVALYDQLVRIDPSPIIALNRAIAVAELDGPDVALAAVNRLEDKLAGYHAYHATRADLLRRLGQSQKSRAAYDKAIDLAGNTAETAYLTRRRDQLR